MWDSSLGYMVQGPVLAVIQADVMYPVTWSCIHHLNVEASGSPSSSLERDYRSFDQKPAEAE